jgi:hypothetical protein
VGFMVNFRFSTKADRWKVKPRWCRIQILWDATVFKMQGADVSSVFWLEGPVMLCDGLLSSYLRRLRGGVCAKKEGWCHQIDRAFYYYS